MKKWYEITAKAGSKRAEISIFESIGKDWWGDGSTVSAKQFISDVKALGTVEVIDLLINSNGGAVFEGNVIYNFLKGHPATVNVKIMGMAASIASVVAMAGDAIEMPENAMMMIHQPMGGILGTAAEMRKYADAVDKLAVGIATAYRRSGQSIDKITDMMDEETWLTAAEAVKLGFADTITEGVAVQASLDSFKHFKNVPSALLETAGKMSGNKQPKEAEMEMTLDLLKADYPDIVAAIKAEVAPAEDALVSAEALGAEKELARIKDVQEQLVPGHEKLVAEMMFDGITTGPEAAVRILAAEKLVRADALAAQKKDAPGAIKDAATDKLVKPDEKKDAKEQTVEERCRAEWEVDADLRAEFDGDIEAYIAGEEAMAEGRVKYLRNKSD